MATVYLAEDVKHQRKVAVKVLHPELAAVLGAERFLHEIKVTANLQHPNILAGRNVALSDRQPSRDSHVPENHASVVARCVETRARPRR